MGAENFARFEGPQRPGTSITCISRRHETLTERPWSQPCIGGKFNLKTAKAFGLDLPPTLLALPDEVIE